jgi:phosphoesterase RecJ-like protein
MEKILKKIESASHIVIVIDDISNIDHVAFSNALYTYLMQLHKKVSIYCDDTKCGINMDIFPWMNKIKSSYPASADLDIKAGCSLNLYEYFTKNDIRLNQKMSTSLYCGLLHITDGFRKDVESFHFNIAQTLIENGVDASKCIESILKYQTLSQLRLKSILLEKMVLKGDAKIAEFHLEDSDLKKSGADIKECLSVLDEALSLPTVKSAKIIYKKNIYQQRSR